MGGVPEWHQGISDFPLQMKRYFESIVRLGLVRLDRINPILGEKAVKALKENSLVVDCKGSAITPVSALTKREPWATNIIKMGSSAWHVFVLAKEKTDINEDLIETLERSTESKDFFNIPVVFHEFLHFANFDNLKTKQHNDLQKYGLEPFDDLVYSCMCAVFPSASSEWFKDEASRIKARNFCGDFAP